MVVNDADQRVVQEVYLAVKDVDAAVCQLMHMQVSGAGQVYVAVCSCGHLAWRP